MAWNFSYAKLTPVSTTVVFRSPGSCTLRPLPTLSALFPLDEGALISLNAVARMEFRCIGTLYSRVVRESFTKRKPLDILKIAAQR